MDAVHLDLLERKHMQYNVHSNKMMIQAKEKDIKRVQNRMAQALRTGSMHYAVPIDLFSRFILQFHESKRKKR